MVKKTIESAREFIVEYAYRHEGKYYDKIEDIVSTLAISVMITSFVYVLLCLVASMIKLGMYLGLGLNKKPTEEEQYYINMKFSKWVYFFEVIPYCLICHLILVQGAEGGGYKPVRPLYHVFYELRAHLMFPEEINSIWILDIDEYNYFVTYGYLTLILIALTNMVICSIMWLSVAPECLDYKIKNWLYAFLFVVFTLVMLALVLNLCCFLSLNPHLIASFSIISFKGIIIFFTGLIWYITIYLGWWD